MPHDGLAANPEPNLPDSGIPAWRDPQRQPTPDSEIGKLEDSANTPLMILGPLDLENTCRILPHFEKFCEEIDILNAWAEERIVRRYFKLIINYSVLFLCSPISGAKAKCVGSVILDQNKIMLRFIGTEEFYIAITDLALGMPITCLYVPDKNVAVRLRTSDWGIADDEIQRFRFVQRKSHVNVAAPSPVILSGDGNFAHMAWNQLPCLDWLSRGPALAKRFPILVTHEPLGPISELLPDLRSWNIQSLPIDTVRTLNTRNLLIVPTGSTVVTADVSSAIQNFSLLKCKPGVARQIERLRSNRFPTIWFSVRGHQRSRTLRNQIEYITSCCNALAEAFDRKLNFVFDSFSPPSDPLLEKRYDIAEIKRYVDEEKRIIFWIIASLDRQYTTSGPGFIFSNVGLDVLSSIAVAAAAHFYVCGAGTIQHKIGWFSNATGLIHAPKALLSQPIGNWAWRQAPTKNEPCQLPAELVRDVDADDPARDPRLSLQDYEIVDVPAATNYTVNAIISRL